MKSNWFNYPSYNLSPTDLVAGDEEPVDLSFKASTSAQDLGEDITSVSSESSSISDLPLDLTVRKRDREEDDSVTSEKKRMKSSCGIYS